jgi:NitT/TauT family transport system substrate-binding protein
MGLLRALVLGACLLACAARAGAATDAIRLMVSGIEKQIYLPAVLAQRLGYFKEEGLEVQLLSESSGVNAEDELLAGSAQGVVGFYDHTIDLQSKGKFVRSVVQFSRAPGEAVLVGIGVAEQLRSPADFKGRTLGVTGLGSSTHLLTAYLGATHGVKIAEMNFAAVGSGAQFVAAIRQGRVDAGMTTEPTASRLLLSGDARLLVDLRTPQATEQVLGGIYPGACLYMTTLWIGTHKHQVQKLVNAFVKALRYIDSHAAEDIAARLPLEYYQGDRLAYIAALNGSKSMFTPDGAMPPAGPATALKVMRLVNRTMQGKTIDLSLTYTTEFAAGVR